MAQTGAARARLRLILINVCIGQFIVGLDNRALLVALPTLTQSFNTTLTTIQWTVLIYDLALVGCVITVGRLGDLLGRRRIYAGGFLLFIAASALCGLSQSPAQLIAFRALQAIGGSMIVANGRATAPLPFGGGRQGARFHLDGVPYRIFNRSDARRLPHRLVRVALDFQHQPADRPLGRVSGLEGHGGKSRRA